MSNEYYDDPYMMGMEGDYTVVDYTQPSTQDFNNPNTDKSVAIVDQSPKYNVEETSIFVETITPPQFLARDQQIEVLNLIEAGEIVSIELVTDNPYVALYIEMDDFKYKTPNGMTAAELLLRGRDEYAERHFYVEGPRPDGMYVVKFHPRTDYKYTDRLKIVVRNDITKPANFRGNVFTYTSRASLPTPTMLGFNGGAVVSVPGNSAILNPDKSVNLGPRIARNLHTEVIEGTLTNDQFRVNPLELAGASHPFVGNVGKVLHGQHPAGPLVAERVVWAPPATAATSTTVVASALTTTPFPGTSYAQGSPSGPKSSTQQFIIYASNAEDETAPSAPGGDLQGFLDLLKTDKDFKNPLFYSVGDNVYYPGEVVGLHFYDATTSQYESAEGTTYDPVNDGAILVTVSPGFDFTPPKADLIDTNYDALGSLEVRDMKYEAIIQEVNVKRKKKKTLN